MHVEHSFGALRGSHCPSGFCQERIFKGKKTDLSDYCGLGVCLESQSASEGEMR